jgi:hypothetical protein
MSARLDRRLAPGQPLERGLARQPVDRERHALALGEISVHGLAAVFVDDVAVGRKDEAGGGVHSTLHTNAAINAANGDLRSPLPRSRGCP